MTIKYDVSTTGNLLTWDLYSEHALTEADQEANLNTIRENIKFHINLEGKRDFLYLVDLQLFADKHNDRFYRLIGFIGGMPDNNFIQEAVHKHDISASGGNKTSLTINPVHPPLPKGYLTRTPFIQILEKLTLRIAVGDAIRTSSAYQKI